MTDRVISTVQRTSDVSAVQIHRQRRLSSQVRRHQRDYVLLSYLNTVTNNWTEGRSSPHLVSPGVPHLGSCFDLPRHRSCHAPKLTTPNTDLVLLTCIIYSFCFIPAYFILSKYANDTSLITSPPPNSRMSTLILNSIICLNGCALTNSRLIQRKLYSIGLTLAHLIATASMQGS